MSKSDRYISDRCIKLTVVLLAVASTCCALGSVALISMDLPQVYLRPTIAIYFFCTFVVIYSLLFLIKKSFAGSDLSWQAGAHIIIYLLAYLICASTVFGCYHQLKFAAGMLVMVAIFFGFLLAFNTFVFILFSRNEDKHHQASAEQLLKDSLEHPDYERQFGCYSIPLYDDDVNLGAGGSGSNSDVKNSKSVNFK